MAYFFHGPPAGKPPGRFHPYRLAPCGGHPLPDRLLRPSKRGPGPLPWIASKTVAVDRRGISNPRGILTCRPFCRTVFGIYEGPSVTVRIRFLKSVASYVRERIWHQSQHLSEQGGRFSNFHRHRSRHRGNQSLGPALGGRGRRLLAPGRSSLYRQPPCDGHVSLLPETNRAT